MRRRQAKWYAPSSPLQPLCVFRAATAALLLAPRGAPQRAAAVLWFLALPHPPPAGGLKGSSRLLLADCLKENETCHRTHTSILRGLGRPLSA